MNTESNPPDAESTGQVPAEKSAAKKDSDDNKQADGKDIAVKKADQKKADDKKESASKKNSTPATTKQKQPVSRIAVLAFLLTLLIGSAAGYEFYLLQLQAKQDSNLVKSQKALQSRINRLEQELQLAHQSLQNENIALKATMDTVSAQLGRTTIAWRLAEVEYLLTVANHRLNLVQDRTTAIAIFETADERLLAIGDPGLLDVRKAIADELNLLRGISEPDLTGMALTLASLAKEVEKMPLIFKERVDLATGNKQRAKPESWREIPAAMWEEIKGLVVIRRHEQPTEPLLSPDEAWFLHQNLRLKMEQAQLALLRRDTSLFRKNLEEANVWIQTFFDADSPVVSNARTTLDSLAGVELKLNLPDVSGSLRVLRRLISQRGVSLKNNQIKTPDNQKEEDVTG
ncbi:uroporphyrinogen-III C-methyltransferase [Kaarinaea lacus]